MSGWKAAFSGYVVVFVALAYGVPSPLHAQGAQEYIVQFQGGTGPAARGEAARAVGADVSVIFGAVSAAVVRVPNAAALEALRQNPAVVSIVPNRPVLSERYRIVSLLGRGGMGEVYRAEDLKLGVTVALKFLPAKLRRDPSMLDRFIGEVRLARQISHPNVCRVFDIGEVEGQHFFSMEYIDGEDLGSLLRRIGRLPSEKAAQIARQLCVGLAAAHELGILHRDLKPGNVMLDGRGRARITDFGLAALAGEVEGAEVRAGTPAYQAPEQLAGEAVSIKSDLYSLGLVLYELFTGRAAFEAASTRELLDRQRSSTPSRPSSLVDDIDPAAERAILQCLESDPSNRPASALAVAAALPGGDPLAAAMAAGETPSPELVAQAGGEGGSSGYVGNRNVTGRRD